jgi:membrane protein YdbS with pleckstrin-like domain
MKTIKFECPQCHEIIAGDESSYDQQVQCPKCQAAMLVPQTPVSAAPQTARLIDESVVGIPGVLDESVQETDIFRLFPVARAFSGQIMLGAIVMGLGAFIAMRAHDYSWPGWVALIPLTLGLLMLLLVWIERRSYSYRLTNQRLFTRHGWLARNVNELELYRVEDVRVDQGVLQRLLGYGTITVLAADDTTPRVDLIGISRPIEVKEKIRTQYRAARKREGVRPTEFMQSPDPTQARAAVGEPLSPATSRRG